jgi:hypothetical protein
LYIDINTANGVLQYGAEAIYLLRLKPSCCTGKIPAGVLLLLSGDHVWISSATYNFQYELHPQQMHRLRWQTDMRRSLRIYGSVKADLPNVPGNGHG